VTCQNGLFIYLQSLNQINKTMKQILLLSLALFTGTILKAQCEAPTILDWTAVNDSTVSITLSSSSAGSCELILYNDFGQSTPLGQPYTASIQEGINTVEFLLEGEDIFILSSPQNLTFLSAQIRINCGSEGVSPYSEEFYVSNRSLNGNPDFDVDYISEPLSSVAFFDEIQEFTLNIASGETIENISLFIDMSLSQGQDLFEVELIHPNGTTVYILDSLFQSTSMSAIFSNAATQSPYADEYGMVGLFSPYESLSILQGLPVGGEWKLRFTSGYAFPPDGMLYAFGLIVNSSPCTSSIVGTVYYDLNGNTELDANEESIPFTEIQNTLVNQYTYSYENGSYFFCTESGSGDLILTNLPDNFYSEPVNFIVSEGENLNNLNIPFFAESDILDLSVDLFSLDANRPGFQATYKISIQNIGTVCENNASLSLGFPEYVTIVNSENSDLDISGNTATFDMIEMCPFESVEFNVEILLDDTVSIGTLLEATADLATSQTDANPSDNNFTSFVEVIGAYDPNDKQVSLENIGDEFLEDGSPLKYTIRFQNTGTFYAERVVIADTIDADLDINSLQIISTSHDMQLSREGNVLYFEFDQIFLPDSATDLEGSNGHVRYEMDPLPSFSEGETIENTAYIYFDFNEAIETNTVVTSFQNPLNLSEQNDFETNLFPNPANDVLTVTWNTESKVERIEIFDISGRLLHKSTVNTSSQSTVDISNLANGIYLLKATSNELNSSTIFIKN
jgi:uncharacterized repeat protein (TIGR01451 family)